MFREKHALETPEHVSIEFEVAGPMSRYAAALYDLVILVVIALCGGLLFGLLLLVASPTGSALDLLRGAGIVLLGALLFLYCPLFELFRGGQTPGKKALGIRVMRRDMAPLDFGAVFLRNVLRLVDILPGLPFPLVGMAAMAISERSLRLGDLAAGTWVVRDADAPALLDKQAKRRILPATARAAAGAPAGQAPSPGEGGGRLTEEEWRIAKEFLERRSELDPQARRATALRIASPMLRRIGVQALNAEAFLEVEVRRGPAGRSLV